MVLITEGDGVRIMMAIVNRVAIKFVTWKGTNVASTFRN